MAILAVEQKQQQHGYQHNDAAQAGPNQINLGGFAISFEDLLQRVGARLETAFSAADSSAGIPQTQVTSPADRKDVRSDASSHDAKKSARSDNHKNDAPADKTRKSSDDKRDSAADRSDDAPRADAASDNRADQASSKSRDDGGASDKTEKADNGNHDDKTGKDKSQAADKNDDAKGKSDDKTADAAKADTAKNTDDDHASVAEAPNAIQAAAIYAAGLIGKNGNDTAKSNTPDAIQQAQKGVDVVDNTPAQVAAVLSQKGTKAAHNNADGKAATNNAAANGAQQMAANAEQKGVTPVQQAQAQQLSKSLGDNSRININVNVSKEQNQLTSKPALSDSSTLVLAQDAGKGSQPAQSSQAVPQQGPNAQQIQQAQLVAQQQQTQAAQQGNAQNGPQTAGANTGTANGTPIGNVQAGSGGTQHAGGNEALNSTSQTANAAQQTQHAQQTRESAPQQQAQHLQRTPVPGGSVTEQISVKITKALEAGTDKISIQLKPAELGRVDVKLEMTHDGRVMTVVSAEKQDTLDLLRRDSSELQRALADAGLQSGDMQFNLKGQEHQSAETGGDDKNVPTGPLAETETDENTDGPVMAAWESGIFANGRLDMRA